MFNKKKLCLILMVMVLGTYNIVNAEEQQSGDMQVPAEQESIKANKETFENAQDAMKHKDYQSAIVLLTAYITSKPKKYEAYKLRGECFYALRQYELAQNDFQTAINLKASDDKLITGTKYISAVVLGADKQEQLQNPELGNLYGELMYAQKAVNNPAYESSYDEAVKYNTHIYLPKPEKDDITKINCPQKYGKQLNPQGVDAEIAAVVNDIEAGNFHEAMYKIPSITSSYPQYYLGYYLSGVVFSGMEQSDDAINAFETALKYNPYDFESFASLGEIYYSRAEKTFSSDDAAKSIEYFKEALKYNPHCNTYYFYIGLNELMMKNYQEAIGNFDSAIKEKSNDYNSMYYKAIAQYLDGDYKTAEEDATKLLYRHVSNYNSVLYLRALAKYKRGLSEDALIDIEKIYNDINDIYNADIKPLSDKEKALESYLYYLKSEILQSKGMGTKTDLEKALENPVIANFISAESETILTSEQLDNQLDYIRTTFSDYDINYVYLNPDYRLSAGNKSLTVQENTAEYSGQPQEISEILPAETEPSLAQILASQSLLSVQNTQSEPEQPLSVQEPIVTVQEELPESQVTAFVPTQQEEQISAEQTGSVEQVESVEQIAREVVPQSFVIEAAEKKESPDFEIKYETPKPEPEITQVQPETEKEEIIVQEPVSNIVEKHADVDLEEFEIPKPKAMPEIKDTDEVIVFEPQNIFNRQEQIPAAEPQFSGLASRLAQYRQEAQLQEVQSEPEIIQPDDVQVEEAPEGVEKRISTPGLIVPEYIASETQQVEEVETVVTDIFDNSSLDELAQMLSEITEPEKQNPAETAAVDTTGEVMEEVKSAKAKRRWFRKRVKSEENIQENPPAEEEIIVETETENQDIQEEKNSAISSILQTVFNGENEEKAKTNIETQNIAEEPHIVQDENLSQLEEVEPLEVQSEALDDTENPVSEVNSEEKPQKFGWFKRLFKKKQKTQVTETEPVVQIEPDLEEAVIQTAPQIGTDIDFSEEVNVNEVQQESPKKKFNWFKRKQKTVEPAGTELEPESETTDEPVIPEKKVIKQLEK